MKIILTQSFVSEEDVRRAKFRKKWVDMIKRRENPSRFYNKPSFPQELKNDPEILHIVKNYWMKIFMESYDYGMAVYNEQMPENMKSDTDIYKF